MSYADPLVFDVPEVDAPVVDAPVVNAPADDAPVTLEHKINYIVGEISTLTLATLSASEKSSLVRLGGIFRGFDKK